jgi:hypothetical protein
MIRTTDINEYNTLIQTTLEDVHFIDSLGRPIKSFCVEINQYNSEWINDNTKFTYYPKQQMVFFDGNIGKFEVDIRDEVRLYSHRKYFMFRLKFDGKDCLLKISNGIAYIKEYGKTYENEINWDKISYADKQKLLKAIDKVREAVVKLEISDELKELILDKYLKLEEV